MAELFYSAEARWFFRGAAPAAFAAWFAAGRARTPQLRTDLYLALPGCESVGVKQREGRFEIKALCGQAEPVRLAPTVAGWSDAWVKWSYGGAGVDEWLRGLRRGPEEWIEVRKERRLRRFSLDDGAAREVGPDVFPRAGLEVELTGLQVRAAAWWTFGLEAFGAPEAVQAHLRAGAAFFFAGEQPPVPLDSRASRSYPAWLNASA